MCVDLLRGSGELVQNPALGERLIATLLDLCARLEVTQTAKDILRGLVDLIAEPPVAVNDRNIKGDVTTASCVTNKGHAQSISTALGNTLRKRGLLVLLGGLELLGVQVTNLQLL